MSIPRLSKSAAILAALVAVNAALLALGLGRGSDHACHARVCVGVVLDVGGLGDKSFNDAAYRGLMRAKRELGIGARYIEPGDGSDRESALRQLASQHYDLVIGVGFMFTDDVRKVAAEFPHVRFACVDFSHPPGAPPPPPNVVGLGFREQEGSFLVGAIAGIKSKTHIVGFIGGMRIPLIEKFQAGYTAGVKYVCPKCTVLPSYAGTDAKAFADPTTGRELALAQYGDGADIIFHAAGKTGAGVLGAARELGKYAIGVDSDQYHEAPCCVITSMVKRVDVAVYDVIRDVVQEKFRGGVVHEFGLAEHGVGFVYDKDNRKFLSPATVARVRRIARRIIDGEIRVPWK